MKFDLLKMNTYNSQNPNDYKLISIFSDGEKEIFNKNILSASSSGRSIPDFSNFIYESEQYKISINNIGNTIS